MAWNFKGAHGTVRDAFSKGAESVGGAAGSGLRGIKNTIGVGVGTVTGAISGMAKNPKALFASLGALAVVGAVAGTAAMVFRRGRKKDQVPQISPEDLAPPMPMMGMPQTMMGMNPTPGAHAQSVVDRRNNGVSGPQVGA